MPVMLLLYCTSVQICFLWVVVKFQVITPWEKGTPWKKEIHKGGFCYSYLYIIIKYTAIQHSSHKFFEGCSDSECMETPTRFVHLLAFLQQHPEVHPVLGENIVCSCFHTPVHTVVHRQQLFPHTCTYSCTQTAAVSLHLYIQLYTAAVSPHLYIQLYTDSGCFPTPVHTVVHRQQLFPYTCTYCCT